MCKYADFNLWAPYVPSDDAYSNALHMNQTSTDTKNLDAWFVGGVGNFGAWLTDFQYTTAAFAGVEVLALMPAVMKDPRKDLPIAMVCMLILIYIEAYSLHTCMHTHIPRTILYSYLHTIIPLSF